MTDYTNYNSKAINLAVHLEELAIGEHQVGSKILANTIISYLDSLESKYMIDREVLCNGCGGSGHSYKAGKITGRCQTCGGAGRIPNHIGLAKLETMALANKATFKNDIIFIGRTDG